MKLIITAGCLLLASVSFGQQSQKKSVTDSVRNVDNMPVIRSTGSPARMPVQKDIGTAANMPTRRMGLPEAISSEEVVLPKEQSKLLRIDSSNRVNPHKKRH